MQQSQLAELEDIRATCSTQMFQNSEFTHVTTQLLALHKKHLGYTLQRHVDVDGRMMSPKWCRIDLTTVSNESSQT
jgi:hypothetical protein